MNKIVWKITFSGNSFIFKSPLSLSSQKFSMFSIKYLDKSDCDLFYDAYGICNEWKIFNEKVYEKQKYKIQNVNKIIKPEFGKIFCLNNIENVENYLNNLNLKFISNLLNIQLIKGIAVNVGYPKSLAKNLEFFPDFWKQKQHKQKITVPIIKPPVGTISCDSFHIQQVYTFKYVPHSYFPISDILKTIK